MTGICGICPSEENRLTIRPLGTSLDFFRASDIRYHGHILSLEWNKNTGLRVTVDCSKDYSCSPSGHEAIVIDLS